jgi:protein tyrosine kinase modulator
MTMSETTKTRSGSDVFTAVWRRRKWLALATFAAILAAAGSVAAFLPDRYRGTATVLVERRATESPTRSGEPDEMETRLQTIGEKLLSRAQLEALIQKFDLYRGQRTKGASTEAIIEQMRRDIHLELKGIDPLSGRGATVSFALSYWGDDPRAAAQVANTIAASYVEDNRQSRERQAASSARFLKAQLDEAKVHLDDSSAEQARLVARRDGLMKRLTSMEPTITPKSADAVHLAKLRQQLSDLLFQYKDNHPEVTRTRAEIRLLELQVAAAPPEGRSAGADGLAIQQVKDALAQADANVMSSDYTTARDHYLSLMKLYEEARLNENMEQDEQGVQFAILDPAVVPDRPASPNRFRIFFGGLAMSIGMALGAVVVSERLDTSFHGVDALREFTRLPILASIPRIVTARESLRRRYRLLLGFSLAAVGLLFVVGASYVIARQGASLILMVLGGRA